MMSNKPVKGPMGKSPNMGKTKLGAEDKKTLGRVLKLLFEFYPGKTVVVIIGIVVTAISSALPALFNNRIISLIEEGLKVGIDGVWKQITVTVLCLVGMYLISLTSIFVYNRIMATVTQGFLSKLRIRMFEGMQDLPIKYFDTNSHGDIMSYYTNDVDTLRQLISQSLPNLLSSALTITVVFIIMLYFSFWLTLAVILGIIAMFAVTAKIGGNSAKYFVKQQQALAKTEGFVEEMMNGQKVVKVFCHEEAGKRDFDKLNEQLYKDSEAANRFANILMPILGNIGNVLYVVIALLGGLLIVLKAPNISLSGVGVLSIAAAVPFLNMTRQFSSNISQVSQQLNSIVMAMAGAKRVFGLMDEKPEEDNGYVTLVNAVEKDGVITETDKRTGTWAWKHPHEDGTVTYTPLRGDVRMFDVDFGYVPEKTVLHNISLFAEPGQKVAFVGATGAGKTTITNLINRFYDIADGKIRYDGININKIKKADLRRSMGIVLQDTNLFAGTVMNNIRYGRLDATDEECIAAAKLANAHDFIERLPQGYDTPLSGNGSNLSQGQRQLLSIARAAVADPPVMIMDEATSSIDTRTEALVQKGMDSLMKGRTVFIIAHRLSTVRNSDVIMVLDDGRIIERGSHDQLIEQKGKYYQLYTGAFELE